MNPVYPAACADPFVLRYRNEYWCYCTGWWHDGHCFGVLHSRDLVHWREVGGAMLPYDQAATCYWAPEVWYENGNFLLYYSVGNETQMQIRVAQAAQPEGPFIDCGYRLTHEEFAIDPHVFLDDDGARYLFYATDFLQHSHIGTGTVCDRMLDAFTLAGAPQPVTRARYDWQVYDPQRAAKGGVRWHTVEGPFVLKRKGRYYQMFSGGNWMNESYGATFALSDAVLRGNEWEQVADGQRVLPVLRTLPGQVIGPGHNSAVRGPDGLQWFCVYHSWLRDESGNAAERVMAIDRLDWVGERLTVLGPTVAPQPAPNSATLLDYFENELAAGLGPAWDCQGGSWLTTGGAAVQPLASGEATAICVRPLNHFTAEVSLRFLAERPTAGCIGLKLLQADGAELSFALWPQLNQAIISLRQPRQAGAGKAGASKAVVQAELSLPPGFVPAAFHLLRVEANGTHLKFALDGRSVQWQGRLAWQPARLALFTQASAAAFAGFALTEGWEDLFVEAEATPASLGWSGENQCGVWRVADQQLWCTGAHEQAVTLTKEVPTADYEFVLNVKLAGEPQLGHHYGFLPALDALGKGPLLTVEPGGAGWVLRCATGPVSHLLPLATHFNPTEYQQFRFRQQGGRLVVQHEAQVLGEMMVPLHPVRIGLWVARAVAAFDQVRVTALRANLSDS